jgi:hypothetical protein
MPIPEAQYIRDFVSKGGDNWTERFYKARNNPLCEEYYQADNVGPVKKGDDAHERNNRWALYSSLGLGIDQVRLIVIWDGKQETPQDQDARLVKHMVDLMREMGGKVEQINPIKIVAEDVFHQIDEKLKELENEPETLKGKVATKQKEPKAPSGA